ncbi:DNA mismatch repair protein MutH, partial [Candidatus Saccharibacteria bacterium]|nr:DNA mismatch repair protein MutH [Candidatus Saccharibacteria bacterium]
MKLQEACEKLNKLAGIKFKDLFSSADMEEIIINKGKTGQLLELALGMKLSSADLDFEDGELKTNKCDANGKP